MSLRVREERGSAGADRGEPVSLQPNKKIINKFFRSVHIKDEAGWSEGEGQKLRCVVQEPVELGQCLPFDRINILCGVTDSPLCRACMEEDETAAHVILTCPGVAEYRAKHLETPGSLPEAVGNIKGLLGFLVELECVKTEPLSSPSEWADLFAEHAVKDELVLGPECEQRARDVPGECVKTEPSCSASKWADLYAEHAVKDEFVLGPECVQRPRARAVPGECFYPRESSPESRALAVGAEPAREPPGSRRTLREGSVWLECGPRRGAPPARARGSDRDTPTTRAHGDSDIEEEIYNTIDYDKDPTCDLCGRRFALKSDLMRHVVVHIHTPEGTELEEGSGGDQNSDLPRFLWRWARLVPRECRVRLERCGAPRGAGTRQERAATRPTSAGRDPPQTRDTFLHNVEKTYVCDVCKKTFTLKRNLIFHIKEHLENYASPNISQVIHKRAQRTNMHFSCECKKEFTKLKDLLAHIRIHKEDIPFSCKICERKFKLLSTLKAHTLIHTGETPFSCEICKRKFNQLGSLRRHKAIIHGIYKYTTGQVKFCEICNKRCATSIALLFHKRVHTGEKPYFCGVCKQRFTQSGVLKAHKLIHTGEKPYRCQICEKKFRRLTDLYRHRPVHTGEKPHCCQTCGWKFTRLFRLTEHIRKHTGEKPYCCEICSELFSCYDALKYHKRIHENKANRKRGSSRKRHTSTLGSCVRDDMERKDSNDEKTRDRDVLKKENCADHKQVGASGW